MFHKSKVTVVKRLLNRELTEAYLEKPERMLICDKMAEGREFVIANPFEMPEGMCASAWADIRPYIIAIASGGSFAFMKNKNSILACCTDLFRPVIFNIERME